MKIHHFALPSIVTLSVLILCGGCASGPQVDPQILSAVAAANVNKGTSNKIYNGQSLDYADIGNLVRARLPSHIIVDYLRSTQRVYAFSTSQLAGLKAEGAKPHLLTYLTKTGGFYDNSGTAATGRKIPRDVKDNTMLNQDRQPFFYNAPAVDDWYDSAYTESSYSPFSFN